MSYNNNFNTIIEQNNKKKEYCYTNCKYFNILDIIISIADCRGKYYNK